MFKELFRPVVTPMIEFPVCKTVVKTLVETTFVQNRALDFVFWKNSSGLTKLEKEEFKKTINKIKKGEKVSFSDFGDFIRRNCRISGTECFDNFENTAVLILSNHPTDGPLGGWAPTLIASSEIRRKTGKETLWTHGEDKSTFQTVARRKISENSGSTILVRGATSYDGTRQIIKAFQEKNIVGIHPEGDGSNKLGRAVADAGHFILYAAKKGMPIICSVGFFDQEIGKIKLTFFKIDPEEIGKLTKDEASNQDAILQNRQEIADYVMAEIAKRLPENKRGYYKNRIT